MAHVVLTANLKQYFPKDQIEVEANTILEVIQKMEELLPHFQSYILEDGLSVRKHVNIFLNGSLIDKSKTDTTLTSSSL